jgi:hypothetical protein
MPHTPGPWRSTDKRCGATNVPDAFVISADGTQICRHLDRFEDARLIAAAPELLAACRAALANFGGDTEVADMLRAAVAKAEGTK